MKFTVSKSQLLVCSEEKRLKRIANKYYNRLDCSTIAPTDSKMLTLFYDLVKEYISLVESDLDKYEFDFAPYIVDYMKIRNERDKKYERISIYYHYLVYTLGEFCERFVSNISSNYKRKLYSPKELDIFDMSDMTNEAVISLKKDIAFQKLEIRHSFGSTLIFQTMIERNLQLSIMIYLQEQYVKKLMNASKTQIKFTENEHMFIKALYDYFNFNKPLNYPGNRMDLYNQLFNLLKKYDMLPHSKQQLKALKQLLVEENYTIGSLLHNPVYIKIVDQDFYKLLNILYDVNKLNIRNNIAHCNLEIYNCYDPKISATLFFINTLILSNKIYKLNIDDI